MKNKLRIMKILIATLSLIVVGLGGYVGIETLRPKSEYLTVSFETGANSLEDLIVEENTKIQHLESPIKEGYTFRGWFLDSLYQTEFRKENHVINHDITLYAKWEVNKYYIIFETFGGSSIQTYLTEYGTKISDISFTTNRQGYTFGGWYLDSQFQFPANNAVVNNNMTLYAKWNPGQVTVIFDSIGGSDVETLNVAINTELNSLPIPTRNGYKFLGWYSIDDPNRLYNSFIFIYQNMVLLAKWESLKHTIIFETNGGNTIEKLEVNDGTSLMDLPRPTKDGFIFGGWYLDQTLTTKLDATYEVTSNVTLYAKWDLIDSVISFETNGGNDILPISRVDGTKLTNLPTPTRTGYRFEGWYFDQTLSDKVSNNNEVSSDLTLYAKWERQSYTVNFVTGIPEITIDSMTLSYLEPVFADPLAYTNYTFQGWYLDPSFTTKFVDGQVIRSNMTLYAKIDRTAHTIKFDTVGGTTLSDQIVYEGLTLSNINNPTKEGHTFDGWYLDLGYQTAFDMNIKVSNSFTLYAKWNKNKYVITYDTTDYVFDVDNIEFGSQIVFPATPEKLGYTFKGWLLDGELFTPTTMPANNFKLTADWVINTYQLVFNPMGAPVTPPTAYYTHGSKVDISEPFSRYTGYSFDGWYLDLNDPNSRFDFTVENVMVSDITLYAKWIPNERNIQYLNENGTVNTIAYYSFQEKINILNLVKTGYTFKGWYLDSELTQVFDLEFMPNANLVLYPKFEINQYAIKFANADVADIIYNYDQAIAIIQPATREGFSFNGWYLDQALTQPFNLTKMPANDITVYADWIVNEATIGFETNGGTYIESITGLVGDPVVEPNHPVKEGYEFKGWYLDTRFTQSYTFTTIPQQGIVLYAKFDRLTYVINFIHESHDYVADINIYYNDVIPELARPIKEGYIFVGWYTDLTYTERFTLTHMPSRNITLYAKWEMPYYKLAFETQYQIPSIVAKFGEVITEPVSPMKDGYTFVGWFTDFEMLNQFEFTTMPDKNIYLYAKFVVNNYEIYFETNGGIEVPSKTYNYNVNVSINELTQKEGHTFIGWYLDQALTKPFNLTVMPAENITLYAKYQVNQYVATFVGDEVVNRVINFGDLISYVPPTKVGYSFLGWFMDEAKLIEAPTTMTSQAIILYAKYQINTYTIKFNSNGGTTYEDVVEEYDKLFTPPTPQRLGYTFDGWYTNANFTTKYTSNRITAANVTLYAKWIVNQYKISFTTNGPIVNDVLYNYNQRITAFSPIEKVGYIFLGWYMDANYTQVFNLTNMPASDIRVYAKWEINDYTITFESNGGTPVNEITADYNTILTTPVNPTRVGYTFRGWFTDQALTSIYNFTSMPANNLTLYAKWEINDYRLSFVTYTDTISDIFYEYNEVIKPFDELTRVGYTFKGWFLDSTFTTPYNLTNMPGRNVVVYAKWEINQYTISFESDGGSTIEAMKLNFNALITGLQAPTKAGYTFKGWFTNATHTNQFNLSNMPASDITLYAKWEINTFKVVFRTNIGIVIADRIYDYNEFIEALPVLEEYGNTFLGWYLPDGTKFEVLTSDSYQIKQDIILNARWQKASFTISFESNGGSEVESITKEFNALVNEPTAPVKDKYNFAGWFTDESLTQNYYFSRMSGENITLYAKWVRTQDITVTFVLDNEDDNLVDTYWISQIGSLINYPVVTKLGHTFAGWYLDSEFKETAYITLGDFDLVVYAKWTVNQYTITFDLAGATGTTSITKDFNEVVIKPNDPVKEGYTFIGWFTSSDYTENYTFDRMKAVNETVYAKFEINSYTIKSFTNNGEVISDRTLEFNQVIGALPQLVKQGYTFKGWFLDSGFTQAYNLTTMPARNIELHAKFEINTYKIIFVAMDLNINNLNYKYQETIRPLTPATKIGYTFIGWYMDENFTQEFNLSVMPSNDVTVYAKFEVNHYTMIFNSNGGSAVLPITQNFDTNVTKPTDPTRDGYTFVGWFLNGNKYSFNKMPAQNITLEARWNRIPEILFVTGNTHFYLLETEGVTLRVKASDDDLAYVMMIFNVGGNNLAVRLSPSVEAPLVNELSGLTVVYDESNQEWTLHFSSEFINENFKGQVVTLSAKIYDTFGHQVAEVVRTYSFNVTNAPVVNYVTPSTPVNLVNNQFIYELDVTSTELSMIRLDTNVFGRINIFADAQNPYGSTTNQNRLNALGIYLTYTFNEQTNLNQIVVTFNEEATYQLSTNAKFTVNMSIEDMIGNEIFISNEYVITYK